MAGIAGLGPSAPPMGGAPPGAPGPPAPPPIAPPPGIAPRPPSSLTATAFEDLPSELPGGWQLADAAARQIKLAIKHPTFAKTPKTVAVLYSVLETLTSLIAHYTSRGDSGGAPTSVAEPEPGSEDNSDAHYTSADADAQPAPESPS
jgi:hypothetical protein